MKEKIKVNVIAYIASFANILPGSIKDDYVLKGDPLQLDDTKLGFLTIALRAYLKSMNPRETILVTELRRGGMDVKKTYDLLIKKAGV